MGSWEFGWDAIAALAGVAAVLVASILGWLGIRIAERTVERSKQDYIAERADLVADLLGRLRVQLGQLDTSLLPFWGKVGNAANDGRGPEFAPVQSTVQQIQATCETLDLAVNGLSNSTQSLASLVEELDVSSSVYAVYWTTYVEAVYFFGDGKNRRTLRELYANELSVLAGGNVAKIVMEIHDSLGEAMDVTPSVTATTAIVMSSCAEKLETLLTAAFHLASPEVSLKR